MSKLLRIGRESNNDIVISDQTVSRNHGIFYFEEDGSVYFEDLNSSNGSFVNGNRVFGKIQLQRTDILKVGKALVPWNDYAGVTPLDENTNGRTVINEDIPVNGSSISNSGMGGQSYGKMNPPGRKNNISFLKKYWPVLVVLAIILMIVTVLFSKTQKTDDSELTAENIVESVADTLSNTDEKKENIVNFVDSDSDGISDEDDACPKKKGPIENNGCPYADSDRDGTPDKDDDCEYEYGPADNGGCPYVEEYEEDGYLTDCPHCGASWRLNTYDKMWNCSACHRDFYNCYRNNGEYGAIKGTWVGDGDCDCNNCVEER
jgi:pSer/pThr/pTyr-binding forkhead associated (FHA) protein